jgi:hypothetical protein
MQTSNGDIVIVGQELFLKTDASGTPLSAARFAYNTFYSVDILNPQTFQMTGSYALSLNSMVTTCTITGQSCEDSTLVITATPRPVYDSSAMAVLPLALQHFVFNLAPANKSIQLNDECEMTGIDNIEMQHGIQFFPNPANSVLTIHSAEVMCSAAFFSLTGQCVMTKTITANECQLDISGLAAGCYVVTVALKNSSETFRLIVE